MLWMDFVNSWARDPLGRAAPRDSLQDAGWRRQFAERAGLPPLARISRAARSQLQQLRTALFQSAQRLAGGQGLSDSELELVNRCLTQVPLRSEIQRQDDNFQRVWTPAARGIAAWRYAIADSFAQFLVEGDAARLRVCGNPDCAWVFYDSTRSRTRRWCADSCGDLIKVREFRARKRRKARGGSTPAL